MATQSQIERTSIQGSLHASEIAQKANLFFLTCISRNVISLPSLRPERIDHIISCRGRDPAARLGRSPVRVLVGCRPRYGLKLFGKRDCGRPRRPMKRVSLVQVLALLAVVLFSGTAFAQTDPGVRTGAINGQTGATTTNPLPLTSVTAESPQGILEFFQDGLTRFQEVEVVSNGANNGLGPRFNFNQCSGCHSQPTIGGSSPSANIYPDIGPNPESQVITKGIASSKDNTLPSFITATGPTREARFPFFFNANGSVNTNSPNGGVEDLFTVSGRSDAGSCNIPQPSFATAQQENDIIFRIPTPIFGAGLVENIDDSTLLAIQTANANNGFGISGTFNHNGNDGTISRFGWKAQNKSLEIFAGEAYNVEMGISNELFPQDRPLPGEDITTGLPANCL